MFAHIVDELGAGGLVEVCHATAIRVNSVLRNSGRSKEKGIFPWNHGFTVCRSVDMTSTGDELASDATCRSATSLKSRFRALAAAT